MTSAPDASLVTAAPSPRWKRSTTLLMLFVIGAMTFGVGVARADDEPVVDNSKTTQKLKNLQRPLGQRKIVAVHEFRSSVPEVNTKGATDMFMTALIKSGAFAVAERLRLNEGVLREKQMNAMGQASGNTAKRKIAGAQYVFEGVVTEANQGQGKNEGGITVGGMQIGGGNNQDSIGIDVRVVEVDSGTVIDAINVTHAIGSSGVNVSGVGSLVNAMRVRKGRQEVALNPDLNFKTERKDGVDRALRACIELAVAELVQRYGQD